MPLPAQRQLLNWRSVTPLPLNLYELLEQIILYFPFSLSSLAKLFPNHLLHLEFKLRKIFSQYCVLLDCLKFVKNTCKNTCIFGYRNKSICSMYFSQCGFAVGPKKRYIFALYKIQKRQSWAVFLESVKMTVSPSLYILTFSFSLFLSQHKPMV